MTEMTSHCDYCDNPLGINCNRTATSAVRAKLNGICVSSRFILSREPGIPSSLDFRFFCNWECNEKFLDQEQSRGEKKIHKTQDEKKEGSS